MTTPSEIPEGVMKVAIMSGGNASSGFSVKMPFKYQDILMKVPAKTEQEKAQRTFLIGLVAQYPHLVSLGEDLTCAGLGGVYADGTCLLKVQEATDKNNCSVQKGDTPLILDVEVSKDGGKTYEKKKIAICAPEGGYNSEHMAKKVEARAKELQTKTACPSCAKDEAAKDAAPKKRGCSVM